MVIEERELRRGGDRACSKRVSDANIISSVESLHDEWRCLSEETQLQWSGEVGRWEFRRGNCQEVDGEKKNVFDKLTLGHFSSANFTLRVK